VGGLKLISALLSLVLGLLLFTVKAFTWYLYLKVKLKIQYYYNLFKLKYTLKRRGVPRELRDYVVKAYSRYYRQYALRFSLRRLLREVKTTSY